MLKSGLCDYSDAYILMSRAISVASLVAGGGNNNIQEAFKNCAPFTKWRSEINNTQIDNAKDIVMPMYNFTGYSNNYLKPSGRVWQYCRDEPALTDASALDNFPGNSASFKFNQKITGSTEYDSTKAVQVMVPLKYLSNFWRTLEIPLINCEVILILTWSANFVISNAAVSQATAFVISDTKFMFQL